MHVVMCILGLIGAICFVIMVVGATGGGCLSTILGLALIGGYIGGNVGIYGEFGALGMGLFNIFGIILGIIGIKGISGWESTSSSGPSRTSMMMRNDEDRKNGVRLCRTCNDYSLTRGECRRNGNPKPPDDKCSSWC